MSAQQRKKWRNDLQSQQHGVGASSGTAVASATVPEDDVASGSSPHPNDHEQQAGRHGVANHASTASKKETLNDTNPGSLLVFHSMQTGLSGEAVLAAVKALVPARTVVGFRSATQVEASASGVGAVRGGSSFQGGPLVVEFTNKLNARWERFVARVSNMDMPRLSYMSLPMCPRTEYSTSKVILVLRVTAIIADQFTNISNVELTSRWTLT